MIAIASNEGSPHWWVTDIVAGPGDDLVGDLKTLFPTPGTAYREAHRLAAPSTSKTKLTLDQLILHLESAKNVILQGPPGTGKTYLAEHALRKLAGGDVKQMEQGQYSQLLGVHKSLSSLLDAPELSTLPVVWEMLQMHPSYGYEDLVRGMRTSATGLGFEPHDGILVDLARIAAKRAGKPTVLILDEVNRCDLASVLGELIVLIDRDKRDGFSVRLQYPAPEGSIDVLSIPANLWMLGTMNAADRSIALVDFAVRRRFRFLTIQPDRDVVDGYYQSFQHEQRAALALFDCTSNLIKNDQLAIGHSYFLTDPGDVGWGSRFRNRMRYEVLPLLDAYQEEGLVDPSDFRSAFEAEMSRHPVIAQSTEG